MVAGAFDRRKPMHGQLHPRLVDLLSNELLTQDEAQELESYVTDDPQTFLMAPESLLTKFEQGTMLLLFNPDELGLHPN
jgi:hypothetical protein